MGPLAEAEHRKSRVSSLLKDHKDTLAAILQAAREQSVKKKSTDSALSERKVERILRDLEIDCDSSELKFGSCDTSGSESCQLFKSKSKTVGLGGSLSPRAGMASLSSSGTFTPGQLSAASFTSAFPSPGGLNPPPFLPPPWAPAGSGPSPYEIALMYLQGGQANQAPYNWSGLPLVGNAPSFHSGENSNRHSKADVSEQGQSFAANLTNPLESQLHNHLERSISRLQKEGNSMVGLQVESQEASKGVEKELFGWADVDSQAEGRLQSNSGFANEHSRQQFPATRDSFDERPLPRSEHSASVESPVAQDELQTNQKRPFLKRGSRLLKSVIPKRGEKESWVAEFKGKTAAVPKPLSDIRMDEEQLETSDWGVLNAQKVSGKRVQPVSRVKKAAPVKTATRNGNTFLKAGSRGERPASAAHIKKPGRAITCAPPSAAARKPTLPVKQREVPPVDDLELAEFQALERRLKNHVLEEPEPAAKLVEECHEERGGVEIEEQAFEGVWESQREEEPQRWMGMDEWEEGLCTRASANPMQEETGVQDWEGQNHRSLFRDSQQWKSADGLAGQQQQHQIDAPIQRHQAESSKPILGSMQQDGLYGRGSLSQVNGGHSMPGDAAGVSALVKTIFQGEAKRPQKAEKANSGPDLGAEMAFLKEKMATLDSEIQRFKRENERMERAKQEFEARAEVVAKERAAWEKRMLEEEEAWNRKKEAEAQKLKRDKRVLEQQSRALLQLPSRKARGEADELRAQIAAMEEDKRVREARWRLTVDRLKGRVDELTDRCKELEEEVKGQETRWLERLEQEDAGALPSNRTKSDKQAVRPRTTAGKASADPALQTASRNRARDSDPGSSRGLESGKGQKEQKEGKENGFAKRPARMAEQSFELGGLGGRYANRTEVDALVREGRELRSVVNSGREDVWTAIRQTATSVECLDNEREARGVGPAQMETRRTSNGAVDVERESNSLLKGRHMHGQTSGERATVARWSESKTEVSTGYSTTVGDSVRVGPKGQLEDQREERESEKGSGDGLADELEDDEDELLEEIPGASGKRERVYASGKRVIVFGNGTKKEVHPSGKVCIFFTNGDVKNTHTDGQVEYYYAEVSTWHTQYSDGVEVFHFPNGQVEQHDPDGSKEIFFPDGAVRKVYADGTEEEVATA